MSLGKSALWATLGNWIQQGFSLVTILVLARLLEPASFGVMATALLLVLLGQRILLEGISYFVVQLDETNDKVLSTAFWSAAVLGLITAGSLFLFADFIASSFNMAQLADVLPFLAVIPMLEALAAVHIGLLRREAKFRQLATRTLFSGTLGCFAGITVALLGGGIYALVVQQVVQSIGNCVAALVSHQWRPQASFNRDSARNLLQFSLPMGGNAIVYVGLNRMDIVLLGGFAGPTATGVYSMAKRLARAITDLLVTGVSTASLTKLSVAKSDPQRMEQALMNSLRLASLLAFPAFALLGYFGPVLLPSILGTNWSSVGESLSVLCLFGVVQVPVLVGSNVFVALGQTSRLAFQSMASLLVFLTAALLLRPINESNIALAFLIQGVAAATIFAFQLRATGQSPGRVFSSVIGAAGATVVALLATWAFSKLPSTAMTPLFIYPMQVLLFVTVYLGVSFVSSRSEVANILNRFRSGIQ